MMAERGISKGRVMEEGVTGGRGTGGKE